MAHAALFQRRGPWHHWLAPLLVAGAATLINAAKPPLIDDPAYYAVGRQIARAPLDPYGFEQFWYNQPEPANHILAPPVFLYWLGLGIRLVGDDPVRLKFWLYPVIALFFSAWFALLRRLARPAAMPVLWLTLLSPVLIPNLNFMLDVPAAALALTALVIFLRALERNQIHFAIVAGIVGGFAAQTKYTGGLAWLIFVLAALLVRTRPSLGRWRRWFLAAVALLSSSMVFTGWEIYVWQKYGESHFLFHLRDNSSSWLHQARLAPSLCLLLGAMLPPAAAAALMGLRWQRGYTVFSGAILFGYTAILLVPGTTRSAWADKVDQQRIDVAGVVFAVLGAASAGILIFATVRFFVRWNAKSRWRAAWPGMFLAAWFALEIAGYFALTPFPATRRVLGIVLIGTLIAARMLSFGMRRSGHGLRWLAIIPGCAIGLVYNALNVRESHLPPEAVRTAVHEIRAREPNARIWFVGHWGFQFEAERLGLMPVVPNRSRLEAGDWLIWPDRTMVNQQEIEAEPPLGLPVADWDFRLPLPLRTIPPYYGGALALERWPHPHMAVRIYRVEQSWTPPAAK